MSRRRRLGRLDTLLDMLEYCRPAGSRAEGYFIQRFIANLPNAERDAFGNWHVTVGDADVLWSCHTDTVHTKGGMQKVTYDPLTGIISLPGNSKSNCLGADCTAGVFLMTEMIKAQVPGHYVFHYGEERGGIGSSALAKNCPTFLDQFTMAIALDRRGTTDVITHQGWGRCASEEFVLALAAALGPGYAPAQGVYTDTAEYVDLIPECTNLSVGYRGEHTAWETLDSRYLFRLLIVLLKLDTSKLPIVRNPALDDVDFEDWNDDIHYNTREDCPLWWTEQEIDEYMSEVDRGDRIGKRLSSADSAYLDPIFADVQRTLQDAGVSDRSVIDTVAQSYYRKKQYRDGVVIDMHDPTQPVTKLKRRPYRLDTLPGIVLKESQKERM
jgi:hypothetical protein